MHIPRPAPCHLAFLTIMLLASVASSQENEDEEIELFFAPAETVTTASRHVQPLAESPSAVTVLTREDIEACGALTLPEALRQVPNMDVYQLKPLWYVMGVRGRTNEESDKILLLVDGRDVTAEMIGSPLWTVQYFSLDDVERIEVIRGPGSALYGANAYSGVVNVITRKPGEGPRASMSIAGAERGYLDLSARASTRLDSFSLSASAGLVREDLWSSRSSKGRAVARGRLRTEIDILPNCHLGLEGGVLDAAGLIHSAMGAMDISDMLNGYILAHFELYDFSLRAGYDFTSLDMDIDLPLYIKEVDLVLGAMPPFAARVDKLTSSARYDWQTNFLRLIGGAEYVFNRYGSAVIIPENYYEHRAGVFAQAELEIDRLLRTLANIEIPTLLLNVGLRFDYNNVYDADDLHDWSSSELSPRAALVFVPRPGHSLRLGYAHAFLKPTFIQSSLHFKIDDISNLGFDQFNFGNPELENQTIDSLELGYSGDFFDKRLELKIDLAYNWYRDCLWYMFDKSKLNYIDIGSVRVPDLGAGGLGFSNLPAGSDGHDVEIQIVYHPGDRSRLFFTAGYRQVFDNQTGKFFDRDPVFRLAAGADLNLGGGLSTSLRAFFTGSHVRFIRNPAGLLQPDIQVVIPTVWFLNARLAYKFKAGAATMATGIEGFNILGFHFRELGGTLSPNAPDQNAELLGRRISLFLRAQI
ncbi:MAG TPA: TonB-dependent receptor [Myxococcota bacterium]|nr:TonB-dependent receptor [Myxococcota bacterium]